jgi:hypothetical protein
MKASQNIARWMALLIIAAALTAAGPRPKDPGSVGPEPASYATPCDQWAAPVS